MTRTSAIFGVVSVLTAAIVGGVFIRKKIIDDALYWKAWDAFEENKRRRIKSLEEEIKDINKNINQNENKKESLEKQIKKYDEQIIELETEIEKYKAEIQELELPVNSEKIQRIDNNLKKRKELSNQKKEIKLKVKKLKQNNDFQNKLKSKLKSVIEILEKKQKIIDNYVDYKIRNHTQLKVKKEKMNEKLKSKDGILEELESSKNSFFSIEFLIKKFKDMISQKDHELSVLKKQKFQGN